MKIFLFFLILFLVISINSCDDFEVESPPESNASPSISIYPNNHSYEWTQDENIQYLIVYKNAYYTVVTLSVVTDVTYSSTGHTNHTETFTGDGEYIWNINKTSLDLDVGYLVKAAWEYNSSSYKEFENLVIRESAVQQSGQITIGSSTQSTYNTNTENKFSVPLEIDMGTINQDLTYYIYCDFLKSDGSYYMFNHVSFVFDGSNTIFDFDKEYGGSLPQGDYKLRAKIKNTEGNVVIDADEYKDIVIYGFSDDTYTKEVIIEYDCHADHNFYANFKDEMDFKTKQAFNPTYCKTNYLQNESNISSTDYINKDDQIKYKYLVTFAKDHDKNINGNDENPHIIFMGNVINSDDVIEENIAGHSSGDADYPFSYIYLNPLKGDDGILINDLVYYTIIHELGHQFGELKHASGDNAVPDEHNSPYCVMNQNISYQTGSDLPDNDNNPNNDFLNPVWRFYQNPHFCDKDIQKLRLNIKWGE